MDEKLTIFYNKRTGTIKELCSGVQTMDWFGEEAQDFEMIYDMTVVDFDKYILDNYMKMEVVNGEVKLVVAPVPEKYI